MQSNYYDILGVTADATAEQLRVAYLSLARLHHPDVSRDPRANQQMALINEAYETLSDPARRLNYDTLIGVREPSPVGNQGAAQADWSWLRCEKCGQRDASLRFSLSMLVMSFIVASSRRGVGGGLLCSKCRAKDGIWFSLVSLFLGPWGIPWGPFWAVGAIWSNLGGGIQPRQVNVQLLRSVAAALFAEGRYWEAGDALTSSLTLQDDPDTRTTLDAVRETAESHGSPSVYTPRGLDPALGRFAFFGAVVVAIGGTIFVSGAADESRDSGSASPSSALSGLSFTNESRSSAGLSSKVTTVPESFCRNALSELFIASGTAALIDEARIWCEADPEGTLNGFCDPPTLGDAHLRWKLIYCD